ncbi:MAG: hypothetical protein AAGA48_22425 [Myxococcota bacterium]
MRFFLMAIAGLGMGCAPDWDGTAVCLDAELVDMTAACTASRIDDTTGKGREVADVSQVTVDGVEVCRGRLYVRSEAIAWENLFFRPDADGWTDLETTFQEVLLQQSLSEPPPGLEMRVEQLLATESGRLLEIDSGLSKEPGVTKDDLDPLVLVDEIGENSILGSDEYVFRLEGQLGETTSLLVNSSGNLDFTGVGVVTDPIGPISTLNQSLNNDDELFALTLATVDVPLEGLDVLEEDQVLELRLTTWQHLIFTAR